MLSYADENHQRITHTKALTHVDFAICDSRYEKHWVPTSRSRWMETMVPVGDWLPGDRGAASDAVPYVWTVDTSGRLRRTVVDDRLIDGARRCSETWRSLQELGGVNNSHARLQLDAARTDWEREREALSSRDDSTPTADTPVPAVQPEPDAVIAEPETISTDDAHIETSRCTTCNECTQINNKMFVYNENKQAYIADPDAGTYRQMVEAAESCQVSIIHPGKPRNLDEPNLDELIARAEPFN
jgi:ferredoxin